MNPADASALLPPLLLAADLDPHPAREEIRVWARSGVERLHLRGEASAVFKYAEAPFNLEHVALREAADAGVPVPAVLAAHSVGGLLGMLLGRVFKGGLPGGVAGHGLAVAACRRMRMSEVSGR